MSELVLHLGSNVGLRNRYLRDALALINASIGSITHLSAIYETSAWGVTEQRSFLNQAVLIQTALTAEVILHECQQIELVLGRERKVHWGSRTIDIDIIFYDRLVLTTDNLIIPHALFSERRFVLVPLADIVPNWEDPRSGQTVRELMEACRDEGRVVRVA